MIDQASGAITATRTVATITSATFTIDLPNSITTGRSYNVDFYADLSMNGAYDAPPTDHAWRLRANDVQGDVTLTFAHSGAFTDIAF